MTWRWISSHAEFAALAQAWDAAVTALAGDNPFLLSEFLRCYAAAFVPEGELRILALYDNSSIIGGLPLYHRRRHRRPHLPTLRYLGLGFANLTEPFHPPGAEEAFARACTEALAERNDWQLCALPLCRHPWWRQRGRCRWLEASAGSNARLVVDRPAEQYVLTLSPKMQANLRRCRRHAAAMGEVALTRESSPEAVATLIQFQLHHNGPFRYAPDVQVSPDRGAWADFTRTLLLRLAAAGHLDAMALRIGGQLAAAGFGYRYGAGYKSMLISHDQGLGRCGPGLLFFHELIDWCRDQGDPWIDMYAAGEAVYAKRRWCHEFVPLYQARLFPSRRSVLPLYYSCRFLLANQ
jgi:CelD/BcsL family acetyltransferase involved in cellulose biosynthesis